MSLLFSDYVFRQIIWRISSYTKKDLIPYSFWKEFVLRACSKPLPIRPSGFNPVETNVNYRCTDTACHDNERLHNLSVS